MRILLDMDSIIVDLMTDWLGDYNRAYGDDLTLDKILSWDTHLYAKAGKDIYKILNQPGFIRKLKPLPGAIEAVRELNQRHEVYVVSAAAFPVNYSDKVEWFAEHLPFMKKSQLVLASEKQLIPADALVDDGPHNAEAYRKAYPDAMILTIGYPYNEDNPAYNIVAGSWKDPASAWKRILKELA